MAQRGRGRPVRGTSDQWSVRGMGFGAKKRSLHAVLCADVAGVPLVCAEAQRETIRVGWAAVHARAYVEAHGYHSAFWAAAAGLLAARAGVGAHHNTGSGAGFDSARVGKGAAIRALGRECR